MSQNVLLRQLASSSALDGEKHLVELNWEERLLVGVLAGDLGVCVLAIIRVTRGEVFMSGFGIADRDAVGGRGYDDLLATFGVT